MRNEIESRSSGGGIPKLQHRKTSADSGHRIGFYIRVSTEEQAENPEGSIKNQEERLRASLSLKNLERPGFGELAGDYIDRARSGKDMDRPELQRLLIAIRRQEIDLVMVSELSRLSRSIKDFSEIWELMKDQGCGFLSLRENFDTTTAAGEMVLYTIANIAQFERKQIGERVSANVQSRASRGLYNGGPVPLGFRLIEDRKGYLEPDPEQSVIVKKAFEAFLKQRSLTRAATWLNEYGYRYKREMQGGGNAPRLGHFTVTNLRNILRNKSYAGIKTYQTKSGQTKEAKAVWEPLVDAYSFEAPRNFCRRIFAASSRSLPIATHSFSLGCSTAQPVANGSVGKRPTGMAARSPTTSTVGRPNGKPVW